MFIFVVAYLDKVMTLGDADRYLGADATPNISFFLSSTKIVEFMGSFLNSLFGEFITHFIFFNISTFSMIYLMVVAKFSKRQTVILLLFLSTPSVTIWSSLVGKEALVIFSTCILVSGMIKLHRRDKPNHWLIFFGIYILAIAKPHILPIFIFSYILLVSYNNFSNKVMVVSLLAASFLLMFFLILNLYGDLLGDTAKSLPMFFSLESRLTRENIYFVKTEDLFNFRPDYWLISFMGLKINEVGSMIDFIFYVEGKLLLLFLIYLLVRRSNWVWENSRISIFFFTMSAFFIVWMIIANYPMSILNPGSGMRYRSGFLPALLVFAAYFPLLHSRIAIKRQSSLKDVRKRYTAL